MSRTCRFSLLLQTLPAVIGVAVFCSLPLSARASPASIAAVSVERQIEIHQRLVLDPAEKALVLTLDACGGGYDAELVDTLIALKLPATVFATRKWIDRHPGAVATLRAFPQLFAIEDHGAAHVPAVVGAGKRVYGLRGEPDVAHLQAEVEGGARAIAATGAPRPQWYRGATAIYDRAAIEAIQALGYRIAGFSVNGDAGATLPRREIVTRLLGARNGDIVILHMNKPASETAEALREALPVLLARGYAFVTLRDRAVEPVTNPAALRLTRK